ncbi:MAG: hemerythrin domain-containing protein [Burkholderiales bacterium]|nr:MAG: hemerythrin domain-containing protein [Burkholderiales bacterium]
MEMTLDAITVLRDDHQVLRKLSKELADTTEAALVTRKKLLAKLEAILTAHTTIEEELFYPAYLDASTDIVDARRVAEGIEEHRACDAKVIPDLHKTDPSTVEYTGQLKVLKDYLFHHLQEEEEDMFPKVRELIGRKELQELGEKMMARKKELLGEMA